MRQTNITQRALAQRLGLTQMTVSRALSGSQRIAPQTRERILKLATKLGYRPNGMSRRVIEGRYRGMALVGSSSRPSFNVLDQSMWMAVHAQLAQKSWHLTATYMDSRDFGDPIRLHGLLESLMADAVLIHDVGPQAPQTGEMLTRHRIPAIWINAGRKADAVDFDDIGGARALTDHLLACGYRRPFVLLTGDPDAPDQAHHSSAHRVAGYRESCRLAGITAQVRFPAGPPNSDPGHILHFVRLLLGDANRPDAVVCYEPKLAYLVRLVAGECGISIPQDLGIATFGNPDEVKLDMLYTVGALDYAALGRAAVGQALKKLASPRTVLSPEIIPVSVIPSQSTRPCSP
jgi:LacI family transcriptional regulator